MLHHFFSSHGFFSCVQYNADDPLHHGVRNHHRGRPRCTCCVAPTGVVEPCVQAREVRREHVLNAQSVQFRPDTDTGTNTRPVLPLPHSNEDFFVGLCPPAGIHRVCASCLASPLSSLRVRGRKPCSTACTGWKHHAQPCHATTDRRPLNGAAVLLSVNTCVSRSRCRARTTSTSICGMATRLSAWAKVRALDSMQHDASA